MKPIKIPDYLIIQLKRFEKTADSYKKIKTKLEYPMTIDMEEYLNKPWARLGKFHLWGVVMHKGKSIECGHYVSFTKR